MKRFLRDATLALAMVAATSAAKADLRISQKGPVAYLSSTRLEPGDAESFAAFLDTPRAQGLRIVYLNSRGGNTRVAVEIGRMIRERGLDTGFHVGRGKCVSACTTMFLGGVHRYYIGSSRVADGPATRVGLGFHPSNGGPEAEGLINQYYQEMGVPGATALRYRLYPRESVGEGMGPRTLFFAGGRSAVESGVATSTSEPRDAALRDR
jgi:hypothetical protein